MCLINYLFFIYGIVHAGLRHRVIRMHMPPRLWPVKAREEEESSDLEWEGNTSFQILVFAGDN